MSELRWDPLRQQWTIIAPERGGCRDHLTAAEPDSCPLCPGQENRTPPEIWAVRPIAGVANGPGWRIRVIPSPKPLLRVDRDFRSEVMGLQQRLEGVGAHEIIIDSPEHGRDLADFEPPQLLLWLQTIRARLLDLRGDFRLRYFALFRNHGRGAGARLAHPHTQLLGLPTAPPELRQRLSASRDYYRRHERCLQCDLLAQELAARERIVFDEGQFVAYVPYAARAPFELALTARHHSHDFAALSDEPLRRLGLALRSALRRVRQALDDTPYQLLLFTAPPPHPRPGRPEQWHSLAYDFHWQFSILPLPAPGGGFETGFGGSVTPVAPEEAARILRNCDA